MVLFEIYLISRKIASMKNALRSPYSFHAALHSAIMTIIAKVSSSCKRFVNPWCMRAHYFCITMQRASKSKGVKINRPFYTNKW